MANRASAQPGGNRRSASVNTFSVYGKCCTLVKETGTEPSTVSTSSNNFASTIGCWESKYQVHIRALAPLSHDPREKLLGLRHVTGDLSYADLLQHPGSSAVKADRRDS